MRGEAEISQKIHWYEAMRAGIEFGKSIDSPTVFPAVSQYFPGEAMEMALSSRILAVRQKLSPSLAQ